MNDMNNIVADGVTQADLPDDPQECCSRVMKSLIDCDDQINACRDLVAIVDVLNELEDPTVLVAPGTLGRLASSASMALNELEDKATAAFDFARHGTGKHREMDKRLAEGMSAFPRGPSVGEMAAVRDALSALGVEKTSDEVLVLLQPRYDRIERFAQALRRRGQYDRNTVTAYSNALLMGDEETAQRIEAEAGNSDAHETEGEVASATVGGSDRQLSPVLRLYEEYRVLQLAQDEYCKSGALDNLPPDANRDVVLDDLFGDRMEAISDEMLSLPTTCAADFAAKVLIETCDGGVVLGEDSSLWNQARTLISAASGGKTG